MKKNDFYLTNVEDNPSHKHPERKHKMSNRNDVEKFYGEFESQDDFDEIIRKVNSRSGGAEYREPRDYRHKEKCAICEEWNANNEPRQHPFNEYRVNRVYVIYTCSDCDSEVDRINDGIISRMDTVLEKWYGVAPMFRERIESLKWDIECLADDIAGYQEDLKELEEENESLKEEIARLREENEKLRT